MATIERLKKRPDFLAAAEGRRFHTERMTAQGRLRGAGAAPGLRVGFTVTKRVGHAPERNRIRRRLREAVRAVAGTWPQAQADIVLIARRPALAAPFETLLDDLRKAVPAVLRPRGADERRGKSEVGKSKRGKSGRGRLEGSQAGSSRPAIGRSAANEPAPVRDGVPPASRAGGADPASTPSPRAATGSPAPSSDPNACGGA